MNQTSNATLTNVHDMVVAHRAFRREFRLLPELVRRVAPGDTARATVLAGHGRMLLTGLHLHHNSEDLLLWPKLLERCPPDAELIERMEQYLAHLSALRDEAVRVERLHPTWTGEAAVAQAQAQSRWAAGAAEVQDSLAALRAVAATAHANYDAAVLANRRMWAL